jgi:hypothetical protein
MIAPRCRIGHESIGPFQGIFAEPSKWLRRRGPLLRRWLATKRLHGIASSMRPGGNEKPPFGAALSFAGYLRRWSLQLMKVLPQALA